MILVTGANGFLGQAVHCRLKKLGLPVRPAARIQLAGYSRIGAIDGSTNWTELLADTSVVVHTAARVHVMTDPKADLLAEYHRINVDGTLNLARQAAQAGANRFIFISSIKVNGEYTLPGRPFIADAVPAPIDPYGISKHNAEQGLRRLAQETGLEVVIIRPVLVYGPAVKANFLTMMQKLYHGVPLPLGAIHNQRSLVALDNLVDLIETCLHHPLAANQTFLVSDGEDLSVTELLRRMAEALGCSARLIPVPAQMLQVAARLLGKANVAQRLCGSLQVDINKTQEILNWSPPVSVDDALRKTADHFLTNHRSLITI